MNSARKSFAKPPRASGEGFENIKAAKEIFCDLTYQIRCLNELYNQLTPQSGNRRASSSAGDHQDGGPQRDPKVLQQLRLLKANLRSKYLGNPLLFSSLEHLKVVVMFDGQKQPFFDFRLRPVSGYPTGYPFLIDDSEGTIAGLSEVIYLKVLKAVQEEKESRGFGEGNHNNNNNNNNNNNSSHAAEEGLIRVNIKQEVEDDEEEEELITLEDDSDDESFNDELHQEENYNSQAIPPANTAEQQHHQQPVSRRQSGRQSETLPIKLEPSNSSIATITRVNRPPINPSNRAPRTSSGEAPAAAAAASVAVSPAAAAAAAGATPAAAKESTGVTIRVIQVNPRAPNTTVFPSKSKPQPQQPLPPAHHHHNSTKTSAQQLQQQPPAAAAAAAAAAEERGTLAMKPTAENSSIYRILGNNNNKRPADSSNAAQPQGISKRAKTSTAAGTSSSSTQATKTTTSQAAIAERFLASADFRKAADGKKLPCPICEKSYAKAAMSDHLELAHTNRAQYVSYRCTYPGCTYTNVWGVNVRKHVQREHGCRNDEQYIEKPAAAAAAGAVQQLSTESPSPHTTTTPTTASTTSTSTPQRLSAEEYLRANCPAYVAAKYASTRVKCPDCPSCLEKRQLKDHILSVHRGLKPYHCRWQGCSYTSGWRSNAAKHVKDVHKSSNHAQYIVLREEE
ncbi:hypothetical protein TYRP_001531 [Tyrophagus putrescentiae]|nr:hypothetical protein TYRP_001531 [Tyrophagus putrescentiae]